MKTYERWITFEKALEAFGEDESDAACWEDLKRAMEALSREELEAARAIFAYHNAELAKTGETLQTPAGALAIGGESLQRGTL